MILSRPPSHMLRWAFCCPGVDVATDRSRTHASVTERLVDAAIGGLIGAILGLIAFATTVVLRFR
jgi:hypothetical protein